jgi:threonyl-tRNA synthetase
MSENSEQDQLHAMRHSLAHIMATAVMTIWPEARLGVGPVVENGFYYDVDIPGVSISEDDFKTIEKAMQQIVNQNQPFEQSTKPIDDAIAWAKEQGQPYKEELLNDLKRAGTTVAKDLSAEEMGTLADGDSQVENVGFYTNGSFTDLCRGPHVEHTGQTGAFKLMRVAGAYWRGNENNPQMQRLYGVAFKTKQELNDHLQMLVEAKKRDHRKLGKELDLFVFSDLVGGGLPLFTPRGTVLRNELIKFSEELQKSIGYEAVWAPHMTKTELYKVSGHYDKYSERFDVTSTESDDVFMMKPMNCPHVTQIYASKPRSYRDLPVRYMETTTMYRDEKSGELHGLSRVRALTQDDSHAFVRHDQIEAEIDAIVDIVKQMYSTLDLELSVDLSFRDDSDNYFGEKKVWDEAQRILEEVAKKQELNYKIELGEAAFYGPKIDIYVTDALNRRWQCATVQLDYVQPERFELEYTDENGDKQRPAMIHKAILGSIERFLSVYIEHTAGKFPIWLAPEQVRIISVNQEPETLFKVQTIADAAQKKGLRVHVDNDNESVGKKIRSAEIAKVPYTLVIGEKEVSNNIVMPRVRRDISVIDAHPELHYDQFIQTVVNETKARIIKSSL